MTSKQNAWKQGRREQRRTWREEDDKTAFKGSFRTSLLVQWLRIRLPMQGHRFEPWSRKIPHAAEQLSLCTATTEPAL